MAAAGGLIFLGAILVFAVYCHGRRKDRAKRTDFENPAASAQSIARAGPYGTVCEGTRKDVGARAHITDAYGGGREKTQTWWI